MSKYHAKQTELDGIWFDSQREAFRYSELKMLLRSGIIRSLELQVPFVVTVCELKTHKPSKAFTYLADFVYQDLDGRTVVEDVKGFKKNAVYLLKKKMVEAQYGIRILET